MPLIPPFPAGSQPPPSPEAGTPPPPTQVPDVYRGWADLRNSVNRHLPNQLRHSQQAGQVTLAILRQKFKGLR